MYTPREADALLDEVERLHAQKRGLGRMMNAAGVRSPKPTPSDEPGGTVTDPGLIEPDQLTHGPFTGHHEHRHGAHRAPDADGDGKHMHMHWHDNDGQHAQREGFHEHGSAAEDFSSYDLGRREAILAQEQFRAIPSMTERAAARREAANRW